MLAVVPLHLLRRLRQDRLSRCDPQPRMSAQECWTRPMNAAADVRSRGEPLSTRRSARSCAPGGTQKFVSLCTNALLLERSHLFEPSPYLFFSVHLDA